MSSGATTCTKPLTRKVYTRLQRNSSTKCSSIPCNYQIVSKPLKEKKGFNSRSVRLQPLSSVLDNDLPGPNHYNVSQSTFTARNNESLSKQGTCGFPSKAKRLLAFQMQSANKNIGPGSYDPILQSPREDFNRTNASRMFHGSVLEVPIDTTSIFRSSTAPAPNSYNILTHSVTKNRYITAHAAFKSKTPRVGGCPHHSLINTTPGPGHYDLIHHTSNNSNRQTANFQSKTKRDSLQIKDIPGPGHYFKDTTATNSNQLSTSREKSNFIRQKHYLCISAPAIPLPPLPPSPGPGHYEICKVKNGEQSVSGSVFKSTSSRWKSLISSSSDINVGPGSYDPVIKCGKRSFLYNWKHKWL